MDNIYILDTYSDIKEYEGFGWTTGNRSHRFQVKQHRDGSFRPWDLQKNLWFNDEVIGRVRKWNDLPMMYGVPIFSDRAVDIFGDTLSRSGELLPVKTDLGNYFAYNCKTVIDCLDLDHTDFSISPREVRSEVETHSIDVSYIDTFNLIESAISESIFRIQYITNSIFVTRDFVELVRKHKLNGFNFVPIWPNDGKAYWWAKAKTHREYCERKAKNFRRKHKGVDAPPLDPVEVEIPRA